MISLLQECAYPGGGPQYYPTYGQFNFPSDTTAGSLLICMVWGSVLNDAVNGGAPDPVVIYGPTTPGFTWTLAGTAAYDSWFSTQNGGDVANLLSFYYIS